MLELRPGCEACDKDLPPGAQDAMICTFECTFCRDCVETRLDGRCPNCGKTPLFKSYLKQVDSCSNCGAEFGRIRADDGAPWLTIIVVGHVFLPLIFFVDLGAFMPFWAGVFAWAGLFSALSLVLLPRAKGFFIALLFVTRAPGVENG